MVELLIKEAKLSASLQHPNIVPVFDFGAVSAVEDGEDELGDVTGNYYIAMEYVAGQNATRIMNRLVARNVTMSSDIALYITGEIARGLAYAHSDAVLDGGTARIVHRDVSPHNVLISYDGAVKIADFGVAKVENQMRQTKSGELRGKVAYMSPEQILTGKVDHRTDLFALGCVLYEFLTATPLFTGASIADLFRTISTFDPHQNEEIQKMPARLQLLLGKALHPDPDFRFSNAREMERSITQALGSERRVLSQRSLATMMRVVFRKEYEDELREDEVAAAEPSLDTSLPDAEPSRGVGQDSSARIKVEPLISAKTPPEGNALNASHTGIECVRCGKVVETFIGDSEFCFACLDEQDIEASRADEAVILGEPLDAEPVDTSYVSVVRKTNDKT